MSRHQPKPPDPEPCLIRCLSSSTKGGTLIAEDAWCPEAHSRRLSDPDGYRPASCLRCGATRLHVHDYRERRPPDWGPTRVIRYRCSERLCGARWQVLPAFLARHLWYSWPAVEHVSLHDEPSSPSDPSARTVRRYRSRLASSGRQLRTLCAEAWGWLAAMATQVPLDSCRRALVAAYDAVRAAEPGQLLGRFAALIDRLERGVRLM